MSWKTFKLLYQKFVQDNVYQIFFRIDWALWKLWQIHFDVCFSVHSVYSIYWCKCQSCRTFQIILFTAFDVISYLLVMYVFCNSTEPSTKLLGSSFAILATLTNSDIDRPCLCEQAAAQRKGIYACCEMLMKLHSVGFIDFVSTWVSLFL